MSAWLREYPDRVLFKGKELVGDPADYFLTAEKYKVHCLPPKEFARKSRQPQTVVFDIRDIVGRQKFPIRLTNVKHYPVDRVVKLIQSGSRRVSRKKILILDCCGTQSKWLQYALEEAGVEDYFFLEGGVLNWRQAGLDSTGRLQTE